ncbi:hypothetical protein EIP86_000388 [Pleurotus ostreatoroseus]|nr:hypothetical protein EIP86_000388 [Pleurotus ostreatoroseus]
MPSDQVIHALAGAAGGIVAMSATYSPTPVAAPDVHAAPQPSDLPLHARRGGHGEGVQVRRLRQAQSTYEAVTDIIKREGIRGLYSGVGSSLLGIAVTNGVYYYFYEHAREIILRSRAGSKGLGTLEAMLAGVVAGSATTACSNPIWVVQTAQTIQTMEGPASPGQPPAARAAAMGILDTIRFILRKDGPGAFWRGIGPALILVVNPVLQYTVFEQMKNMLVRSRKAKLQGAAAAVAAAALLTDADYFLLGALSKLSESDDEASSVADGGVPAVATGLTYPCIVIKSRLQAGHLKYRSFLDGVLTILQNEGLEGLYKGMGNKLLQSVLTAAILFAGQRRFYELTKQALAPIGK